MQNKSHPHTPLLLETCCAVLGTLNVRAISSIVEIKIVDPQNTLQSLGVLKPLTFNVVKFRVCDYAECQSWASMMK